MRRLADLLDEILGGLRHLVMSEAEDELQFCGHAIARGAQLAVELIELEQAVHGLLGEDESAGRARHRLAERLPGRVGIHQH